MKDTKPDPVAAVKTPPSHTLSTATAAPETQINPPVALQGVAALPSIQHPNPLHVQALQRTLGNQAVNQLLARRTNQAQRSAQQTRERVQRKDGQASPAIIQREIGSGAQVGQQVTSLIPFLAGEWVIAERFPLDGPATHYMVAPVAGGKQVKVMANNGQWNLVAGQGPQPGGGQAVPAQAPGGGPPAPVLQPPGGQAGAQQPAVLPYPNIAEGKVVTPAELAGVINMPQIPGIQVDGQWHNTGVLEGWMLQNGFDQVKYFALLIPGQGKQHVYYNGNGNLEIVPKGGRPTGY